MHVCAFIYMCVYVYVYSIIACILEANRSISNVLNVCVCKSEFPWVQCVPVSE